MKIIQRIDSNPRQAELLFTALEKYPGCFTDVWLNTAYGYPSNEVHSKTADYYAGLANKFREKGIGVSLQLSNTIGHGTYMSSLDCSALVYEGSPVRKIVGQDGKVCEFGFCWNDRFFRDYILEHVRDYVAKVRPQGFWIDDDFRAINHAPVSFGCFCDDCMARFNSLHGTAYSRDELVEDFLHGDISVRENFINFTRDSMADFMREICLAVHESCPETAVAYQNGANGVFTGPDHAHLFDVMYRTTGHAPMYRAGGGASFDHNPNEIIDKSICLDWQHSKLPEYVTCKCPEIENIPNTALGKTMRGVALETSLYLASGATGISYAMLGNLPENPDFYEKGFRLFAQQHKYWEDLAKISETSVHGGLTYAHSKTAHLRPLSAEANMFEFNGENFGCARSLMRWGVAVSYAERENGVFILHPEAASQMSTEELGRLLSKNVITDCETALMLQEKGIDLGIEARPLSELEILRSREIYSDHPVNRVGKDRFSSSFFSPGSVNHYAVTGLPEGAEPLGVYAKMDGTPTPEVTNAVFSTSDGGKWAVIGYSLWKYLVPSSQRDRILNIADYIGGNALAARILDPVQSYLLPRVDKISGKTLSVSHVNCTIEPQNDLRILIRNPAGKNFRLVSQYDGEFTPYFEETPEGCIVTVPQVSPWSMVTVFCE